MLHIDTAGIPNYAANWPATVDGEGDDKRYALHEVTTAIGFSAMAVQLPTITADNVDEWMYRLDRLAQIHKREQDITREQLEGHIGLRVNVGAASTREAFDDFVDMRRIEEAGGFPGIWQHVRRETIKPGEPCDIYVELSRRHDRSERRRVEAYRDGTLRTYDDGYNDIEEDNFDDGMGDALTILNGRTGITAQSISESYFEMLYERAHASTCRWEVGGNDALFCGEPKEQEGDAWCPAHKAAVAANLPRISG